MLKQLKVLYAEDEEMIRRQTAQVLTFFSADVIEAEDGMDAWIKFQENKPDIVIADIEMPKLNGLELTENIRAIDSIIPIIIITAYTNTEYFIKAIKLNLTKYLLKPVQLDKLEKALMLCKENIVTKNEEPIFLGQNTFFHLRTQQLIANAQVIHMVYHERELLKLLIKNTHRVVTYQEILSEVWEKEASIHSMRSVISSIRKKLPIHTDIKNISQSGYRLILKD